MIQSYLFALVTAPFSYNPQPIHFNYTFFSTSLSQLIQGEHLCHATIVHLHSSMRANKQAKEEEKTTARAKYLMSRERPCGTSFPFLTSVMKRMHSRNMKSLWFSFTTFSSTKCRGSRLGWSKKSKRQQQVTCMAIPS